MSDLSDTAAEIHDEFSEHVDATVDDVEARLEKLVTEYKVPLAEARRSVENHYLDEAGLDRDELGGRGNDTVQVEDVDEPEQWVDLTAKVVELWEPRSDSVGQVGLLGDPTGTIKFTKWAKSDLANLEEGKTYRLGNVVTDEYQGRYSVKLNKTTSIEEVDEEFDALVLAEAGLQRAGLLHQVPHQRLPAEEFVPAPGQGALAITATAGDAADALHDVLDHPRTRVETTVERTVLAELNGGCIAPIGAYAVLQGAHVHVTVRVLSPDGAERVEGSRDLPVETHAEAAAEFAADLRERGAAELVERAREEADRD